MPSGDRTGPAGMGPMTGRQAGYCNGYNGPGYANPGWGGGFGRGGGRGFGRGFRRGFGMQRGYGAWAPAAPVAAPPATDPDELSALREEAQSLRVAMEQIEARIQELAE